MTTQSSASRQTAQAELDGLLRAVANEAELVDRLLGIPLNQLLEKLDEEGFSGALVWEAVQANPSIDLHRYREAFAPMQEEDLLALTPQQIQANHPELAQELLEIIGQHLLALGDDARVLETAGGTKNGNWGGSGSTWKTPGDRSKSEKAEAFTADGVETGAVALVVGGAGYLAYKIGESKGVWGDPDKHRIGGIKAEDWLSSGQSGLDPTLNRSSAVDNSFSILEGKSTGDKAEILDKLSGVISRPDLHPEQRDNLLANVKGSLWKGTPEQGALLADKVRNLEVTAAELNRKPLERDISSYDNRSVFRRIADKSAQAVGKTALVNGVNPNDEINNRRLMELQQREYYVQANIRQDKIDSPRPEEVDGVELSDMQRYFRGGIALSSDSLMQSAVSEDIAASEGSRSSIDLGDLAGQDESVGLRSDNPKMFVSNSQFDNLLERRTQGVDQALDSLKDDEVRDARELSHEIEQQLDRDLMAGLGKADVVIEDDEAVFRDVTMDA